MDQYQVNPSIENENNILISNHQNNNGMQKDKYNIVLGKFNGNAIRHQISRKPSNQTISYRSVLSRRSCRSLLRNNLQQDKIRYNKQKWLLNRRKEQLKITSKQNIELLLRLRNAQNTRPNLSTGFDKKKKLNTNRKSAQKFTSVRIRDKQNIKGIESHSILNNLAQSEQSQSDKTHKISLKNICQNLWLSKPIL